MKLRTLANHGLPRSFRRTCWFPFLLMGALFLCGCHQGPTEAQRRKWSRMEFRSKVLKANVEQGQIDADEIVAIGEGVIHRGLSTWAMVVRRRQPISKVDAEFGFAVAPDGRSVCEIEYGRPHRVWPSDDEEQDPMRFANGEEVDVVLFLIDE
ncbi:MAG: hypothetical protein AAF488_02270 [Planctomycetota bacterium]